MAIEPKLVFPDYCHQKAMEEYARETRVIDSGPMQGVGFYEKYQSDFRKWIMKEKKMHLGIELEPGIVPGTTYFYMKDKEIIGCINIRHCLNDYLLNIGGHIGYSVAPKYRKQGYATRMLKEALIICRKWEIWPVLVTCNEKNIASRKTIEKCGGVLENKYSHENEVTLRYWIKGEER